MTSNRKNISRKVHQCRDGKLKNDPNKNGMTYASHTLPSLHLFTFFCSIEVCVLLEHVLISYTGGVCYLWVLEASFEASFREVGVQ